MDDRYIAGTSETGISQDPQTGTRIYFGEPAFASYEALTPVGRIEDQEVDYHSLRRRLQALAALQVELDGCPTVFGEAITQLLDEVHCLYLNEENKDELLATLSTVLSKTIEEVTCPTLESNRQYKQYARELEQDHGKKWRAVGGLMSFIAVLSFSALVIGVLLGAALFSPLPILAACCGVLSIVISRSLQTSNPPPCTTDVAEAMYRFSFTREMNREVSSSTVQQVELAPPAQVRQINV